MAYDILVDDLWWKYQGSKDWVLKGINLKINKGEFIGITGPSGAGKTTLCMCMNGLIPQRSKGEMEGKVLIKGMNTRSTSLFNIAKRVGMVFQDPENQFVTMSVEDEVAFPLENFMFPRDEIRERIDWALSLVHLKEYLNKYPFELSGGEKQRVAIASGLALKPEILILDEPTSDLDPIGKSSVFSVISELKKKLNVTLIVVEHLTEELVKYADRIVFLFNGEIVRQGPPHEFFKDVDFLKERGVYPPQVAEFFNLLRKKGEIDSALPLTLEEAKQKFSETFRAADRRLNFRKYKMERHPVSMQPFNRKEKVIVARGLWYKYPDGTVALDGIDLDIHRGEIVAIIGQNGSGKTTLAKHFVGLLKPTMGTVKVFGRDTREFSVSELASKVAYTFQNPDHQLFCETVYDECAYGPRNLGLSKDEIDKRVHEALEAVGLLGFENEPPFFLGKGQRQRLAVASVLTMKPDVIIVDEPTTGQDIRQSEGMMNLLKKLNDEGRTIIIITHNMRIVAEHASRTIVLFCGRVLMDDLTPEVFSKPQVLKETFLNPPQITRFAQSLTKFGFSPKILTVEEMADMYDKLRSDS